MNKNLEGFYSVQQMSGLHSQIFRTQEEAEAAIERWNRELDDQLERWLNGDRSVSDSLIQSNLEPDLEGGCFNNYIINPAWRPSGFYYHEPYSADAVIWDYCPGYKDIQWGNPALARPSRR